MLSAKKIAKIKRDIAQTDMKIPAMFGVLGDTIRFNILRLLVKNGDACVTDIANIFGISVPAASHHLKVLEQGGILRRERMGQEVCYTINRADPVIGALLKNFIT